ncbi:MAG TPA: DUF6438 domain-containing protein [Vicinamibacterales bacterium]|nr:DUF6438 domain-containing protein [Vicinamibacterales bacterium]
MKVHPGGRAVIAIMLSVAATTPVEPLTQTRPDRATLERDLAEARARWSAKKPTNYEFVLDIPVAETPWDRRFSSFRVIGGSSTTINPLTGSMAPMFQGRTTIEALFDLVAERITKAPASSPSYDEELGYVTGLFNPDYRQISFRVPAWRAFTESSEVREPFVLVVHVNHCGFFDEPRSLIQCPSYSIAMWADGTVVYQGGSGVLTLGRREHQVDQSNMRDLSSAIAESGFFAMAADYSSITENNVTRTIDHSAEKWITIRIDGLQKTVHDFYGAPDRLTHLEAAIEKAADSRRYTGRTDVER